MFQILTKYKIMVTLILYSLLAPLSLTLACTRVLSADNPQAVIVGRTMDWAEEMPTSLVIYPRGIARDGMAEKNSLNWVSKYASIVATVFNGTVDGMNEHGLATHILWLNEANYGVRNSNLPGMSVALWGQFYLDQFQTVDEAVHFTETTRFQLERLVFPGTNESINVHLALEDAKGDSAVIEYIDGMIHIFHNKNYTVLTNSPAFQLQLQNLKAYKGFGGEKTLPGTTDSLDRFVRASYYLAHLPKTKTAEEAITGVRTIVDNIAEPFGTSSLERIEIEPTIWRSVINLSNKTYYFSAADSMNFIWVTLDSFNLTAGAPILKLDVSHQMNMTGNVAKYFKP